MDQAAKANPQVTMSWLETQGDRLAPEEASSAFSAAARELQRQSPQQFSAWLTSHPAHPQRDQMIEAATEVLTQSGDFAGALRMSGAIGNLEDRARVAGLVERRSASPQTQQVR